MGGKPSKGTKRDKRLKENKRRKTSSAKSALRKGRRYPTDDQG